MYVSDHINHYGLSNTVQDHAQQVLKSSVEETLDAFSKQPLYELDGNLPALFRPPLKGNGIKQFFKLSFLNAFTLATAYKSLEEGPKSSIPNSDRLIYLGQKNEYHFYRAKNSLETEKGLRLPIDRGTIFVSISEPLQNDQLPLHAFKFGKNNKIDKFYFGHLESRFYEVSFNNISSRKGVSSWFIDNNLRGSYFNTKTLSRVVEE